LQAGPYASFKKKVSIFGKGKVLWPEKKYPLNPINPHPGDFFHGLLVQGVHHVFELKRTAAGPAAKNDFASTSDKRQGTATCNACHVCLECRPVGISEMTHKNYDINNRDFCNTQEVARIHRLRSLPEDLGWARGSPLVS